MKEIGRNIESKNNWMTWNLKIENKLWYQINKNKNKNKNKHKNENENENENENKNKNDNRNENEKNYLLYSNFFST